MGTLWERMDTWEGVPHISGPELDPWLLSPSAGQCRSCS